MVTAMGKRLDAAQDKWARKTAASLDRMARNIKSADAYEKYCSKLAGILDVSASDVKAGPAAKEWKHFVDNYEDYRSAIEKGISDSASAGTWKKGFKEGILGK